MVIFLIPRFLLMHLQQGGGIEYGIELLKKGAIWRDQWIPRETSLALVTKKKRNKI
jgi:hypothetical protein